MPQRQKTVSKSSRSSYKFKESDYIDTLVIYRNPLSFRMEVEKASKQKLPHLQKSYLFALQGRDVAQLFNNPYTIWIYEQQIEVYRDALLFQLEQLEAYC